jgi:uncharacterized protein YjbI with pentapeptide repeats
MLVDMGDGTHAYRMGGVPRGDHPPTVNIFDSEPALQLGSVAQQQTFLLEAVNPDTKSPGLAGKLIGLVRAFFEPTANKPTPQSERSAETAATHAATNADPYGIFASPASSEESTTWSLERDRHLRMLVARSSVSSHLGHRVPLNLAGADLEMAILPYADLVGANLKGANLRGAMLWGAILDDACLDDADFTCADLTWSSLSGCSMKGTLLVEADLDEALVDWALSDAVTAGANTITISLTEQAIRSLTGQAIRRNAPEEVFRENRDDALLRAHEQSASLSLRKRGAAGFKLCRSDPGFTGDWYAHKRKRFEQAQTRVLHDADLHDLLRWSASTGKPLNLRGCNLSRANLRNASLRGACLAFTNATGADIHGVDLAEADLEGSHGWERP